MSLIRIKKANLGKFMLNVGVNQVVAVHESNYGDVQREEPRDMMITAMREVLILSDKEDANLNEADLNYWLEILSSLQTFNETRFRSKTL